MKKILIAVPCMDQVPAPFCSSLAMLQKPKDYECKLTFRIGSLIHTSRNDVARMAIEGEYDFVFWLDSDMVFSPETLIKLLDTLESKGLDFISGLYFRRVPPYSPVLFDRLDIKDNICLWSEFKEVPEDVFKIGGCGFGCVLMKTDILFDIQGKFGSMFTPIGNNGEDVAFCWRARQCGYKLYCDPEVACGHVGYSVIDNHFFDAFKDYKDNEVVKNGTTG